MLEYFKNVDSSSKEVKGKVFLALLKQRADEYKKSHVITNSFFSLDDWELNKVGDRCFVENIEEAINYYKERYIKYQAKMEDFLLIRDMETKENFYFVLKVKLNPEATLKEIIVQ